MCEFSSLITNVETIGSRVKWAREQRGLTQAALAKVAGVSTSSIGNLEAGIRDKPRDLVALAFALGARPAWLATGQGEWEEAPSPRGRTPPTIAEFAAELRAQTTVGATIMQLGAQLAALSPMSRASIAPLIARVVENPDLAAEAARTADAIARS